MVGCGRKADDNTDEKASVPEDVSAVARILIIDDDEDMREMMVRVLEAPENELMEASGGDAGLRMFRRTPADIIVTDILMPEKDGLELIQTVKRGSHPPKIIAVTGGGPHGRSNYLKEAAEFGADELRNAVQILLSQDD
jgi:DNA-binding response OmpR family regulator